VPEVSLNSGPAIQKRRIFRFQPQGEQIPIVGAARLTRLARNVHKKGSVPIGQVDDLSIRRSEIASVFYPTCGVYGIVVATALELPDVENPPAGLVAA
jgi:hypothetical protein